MREHSVGYEKAKKYYPAQWSVNKLIALVQKGKLFDWEYEELVGEPFPG